MNHVPIIEVALQVRGLQHGLPCTLNVGEDQPFIGTLGEFIERIQSACQSAEFQGQRQVYESLLDKGYEYPCPVCDRMMNKDNPLAEDVVLCESCRYE